MWNGGLGGPQSGSPALKMRVEPLYRRAIEAPKYVKFWLKSATAKEDVLRFCTRLDGNVLVFRYVCKRGKIVLKESFIANGTHAFIVPISILPLVFRLCR